MIRIFSNCLRSKFSVKGFDVQKLITCIVVVLTIWSIGVVQARSIDTVEASHLAKQGVLQSQNVLTKIALSMHSGSTMRDGNELKQVYGRYIYRIALLDAKKVRWNVDLDAETGEIVSNMID